MATLFRDLSRDQQSSFHDSCQQLGINPASVRKSFSTENGGRGVVCGHTGESVSFQPDQVLFIYTIRELMTLFGGDSTAKPGDDLSYPQPLAQVGLPDAPVRQGIGSFLGNLTREQHQAVAQAKHVWMHGDPHRVREYEWLINALYFPMRMSVFAVQDVTITADNPLIVDTKSDDPTSLVFGTVTVEPGGYIEARTPLDMNVQTFTVVSS